MPQSIITNGEREHHLESAKNSVCVCVQREDITAQGKQVRNNRLIQSRRNGLLARAIQFDDETKKESDRTESRSVTNLWMVTQ